MHAFRQTLPLSCKGAGLARLAVGVVLHLAYFAKKARSNSLVFAYLDFLDMEFNILRSILLTEAQ